jgi:hypothetical protein
MFSALALGATTVTTIGACLAYVQKAPTWAFFLFLGALLTNVPLGGVIGYVFRVSDFGQVEQNADS